MKQFIPGWIQERLESALGAMPVVVVTGARQAGKSTLVRHVDPGRRRVSYWRTCGGDEVEFVLEEDQDCLGVEIKSGSRTGLNDIRGLRRFVETGRASAYRFGALCLWRK